MPELQQLILLTVIAVLCVALCARLGLGAVLGYLIAGVIVGPWSLGFVSHVDDVMHVAELGVVLLLFVIGLELRPSRLWALRKTIFGLGALQVVASAGVLGLFLIATGEARGTAMVVGIVLSLSSTAFALQLIAERGEMTTRWGRSAFGTLLFQDLAVVPLLALLPLLATSSEASQTDALQVLISLAAFVVVLFGGRVALRWILRLAARSKVREILTATALLVVFGTAFAMQAAGLSMALGAFMAGVLLSDSEFRHQLEADIEPFKGLLLGLFFMTVGMSLNLGLLFSDAASIAVLILAIIVGKFGVLYASGRWHGLGRQDSLKLGIALSQGGEFAFVLFGVAVAVGLMSAAQVDLYIVAVSLSMVVTPLLFVLYDRLDRPAEDEHEYDNIAEEETPVIIIGFGRFGQVVGRLLNAMQIKFTALDASHQQVDFVRQYGNEIYYGDGSRKDLLDAAGASTAKLLVLAIDDTEASLTAAALIRTEFPSLRIYARARNRQHAYQLMELGAHVIRRETFLSAVDMGRQVLEGLGIDGAQANAASQRFAEHDEHRMMEQYEVHHDEAKLRDLVKTAARELEEMFAHDASELTPPELKPRRRA